MFPFIGAGADEIFVKPLAAAVVKPNPLRIPVDLRRDACDEGLAEFRVRKTRDAVRQWMDDVALREWPLCCGLPVEPLLIRPFSGNDYIILDCSHCKKPKLEKDIK